MHRATQLNSDSCVKRIAIRFSDIQSTQISPWWVWRIIGQITSQLNGHIYTCNKTNCYILQCDSCLWYMQCCPTLEELYPISQSIGLALNVRNSGVALVHLLMSPISIRGIQKLFTTSFAVMRCIVPLLLDCLFCFHVSLLCPKCIVNQVCFTLCK